MKVKNAVNFIGEFEGALSHEAQREQVDGVICGHIHHAVIRHNEAMTYINCGDWVESCTAIAEHFDGQMELIEWARREDNVLPWPVQFIPRDSAPEPRRYGKAQSL
jgi:UDP-2,3-diacylglucosamine pyrophosphatase LpxH